MNENISMPIQIKATREGFTLVPNPEAPFDTIRAYLEQRLKESAEFFSRANMTLDLRGRSVQTAEIADLHKMLVEKGQVKMVEVKLTDDLNFILERNYAAPVTPATGSCQLVHEVEQPVIVRSTCRSGMRVESPSDCIVLGDVNPGAEILAVGDVIIFGNLKGIAHAGALGDRSARIWALSIEPSQIRIADLVAIPPRGGRPYSKRFEIAEIQENMIEVVSM